MRKVILLNVCVWIVLLLVFSTTQLPGTRSSFFLASLHNAGHGLAMCFAAILGTVTMSLRSPKHTLRIFCLVPLALFVLSVLIEVVQFFIGRGASADDILMDVVGIAAGTFLGAVFCTRAKAILKAIYFLAGVILLAVCLRLPAYYFIAPFFAPTLPVLAKFDNHFATAEIQSGKTNFSINKHQAIWPDSSGNSIKIEYLPGQWPFVRFNEIKPDWSEYQYVTFDVFNEQSNDVRVNLRVDYESTSPKRAFMVGRKVIPPGHTLVEFSYKELSEEYYESEPDFTTIKSIMLYLSNPTDKTTMYFDNIELR